MRRYTSFALSLMLCLMGCGRQTAPPPPQALLAISPNEVRAAERLRPGGMLLVRTPLSSGQLRSLVALLGTPAPEVHLTPHLILGCPQMQGGNLGATVRLHLTDGSTVDVDQGVGCDPAPYISDRNVDVGPSPDGPLRTFDSPALAQLLARLVAAAG